MRYIEVPDLNDSIGRVTLDGREYYIRFTYNASYDYWSFGLYNTSLYPILPMAKIVPYVPLTHYYKYTDLPDGVFMVVCDKDNAGRKDFVDKKAWFFFMPGEELEALRIPWRTG